MTKLKIKKLLKQFGWIEQEKDIFKINNCRFVELSKDSFDYYVSVNEIEIISLTAKYTDVQLDDDFISHNIFCFDLRSV